MQSCVITLGLLVALCSSASGQVKPWLPWFGSDSCENGVCSSIFPTFNEEDDSLTFDNCEEDDDDGTCLGPVAATPPADDSRNEEDAVSKIKDFEKEAVEKAVGVLKALGFNPEEEYNPGQQRGGRLFAGGMLMQAAIDKALAVLRLFGYNTGAQINTIPQPEPAVFKVQQSALVNLVDTLPAVVVSPTDAKDTNLPNYEPCRGGEGLCTSAQECKNIGGVQGKSIGKCGNCVGCSVCCQFVTGCQGITDKMITYFQSPGYPRTDRSNEACSLTLNVRDEVCQVRLDFVDFEMAAPQAGSCSGVDNFEIINTAQPGGVFGPGQSKMCGLNKGQHVYMPVKPGNILIMRATTSGVRNIPLARTDGTNRGLSGDTAFRWNARVTQIPCEAPGARGGLSVADTKAARRIPSHYRKLLAPDGCRQYFQESRGRLQSFNYDGKSEVLLNQNYAICVKRPARSCGMTLKALGFSLPASAGCLPGNVPAETVDGVCSLCCTSTEGDSPGVNYLGVSGYSDGASVMTPIGQNYAVNQDRYFFCGAKLGVTNLMVTRTKGPLLLRVRTAGNYWEQVSCPDGGCLGFLINYDVDTGTC
eukprot:GFUD01006733.1.p1 GENE.GFUD01006733.1~~GFUD01006733.1.p1  ORF type:complete len:606 (-),score=82.60 GFUD01006733.1:47-1810(-)